MPQQTQQSISWKPIISFLIVFILINIPRLLDLPSSLWLLIVSTSIYLIGFFIAINSSKQLFGDHWKEFKMHPWTKYLWIILGYGIVVVILSMVRKYIMPYFPLETVVPSQSNENNTALNSPIYYIGAALPLLAPFYEELVFRHGLYRQWSTLHSKIVNIALILLSSALFGLIHYFNFGNALTTIPYMFAGLFLALVYSYFKNIWYPIGIHLLLNWINIFLGIIGTILVSLQAY